MEKRVLKGVLYALAALVLIVILSLFISASALDYLIPFFFILVFILLPLGLIAAIVMVVMRKKKKKSDFSQIDLSIKRANEYLMLQDAQGATIEYQKLASMLESGSKGIPQADLERYKSEGIKIYQKIAMLKA